MEAPETSTSTPAKKPSQLQTLSAYAVFTQRNPVRTIWSVVVAVLLVYTATVLPYRLAFIDLALPEQRDAGVLDPIDSVIDAIFWIDLFINFCFTYVDYNGKEVTQLSSIGLRYLRTYFFINLVACLPTSVVGWFLELFHQSGDDKGLHKTLRITRLQRVSRLARLVRLVRLAKFFAIMRENPVWNWIQSLRGVRIINLCCSLLWIVHIVACGWYMCAAFHSNEADTWVARREIGPNGETLLDAKPSTHWINSMYFVLTVFTTVGFGDMSAWTVGEIVYVCFTMVLGCIVNSIILSSVITILTNVDHEARQVDEQRILLEAFAKHTHLEPVMALRLTKWASASVPIQPNFDRSWLKQLLTSRAIPRDLAGDLLANLFDGHLMKNKFMMACQGYIGYHLPPRFPLITALHVNVQSFEQGEIVYFPYDNAWNLFMIISGVFAYFAVPGPMGGSVEIPAILFDSSLVKPGNRVKSERSATPSTTGSMHSILHNFGAKRHSEPQEDMSVQMNAPYQILGRGNYFGEHELLHTTTRTRQTGVRCELDGTTLVLAKDCLVDLMAEFPFVARSWRNVSAHRDAHRTRLLKGHVKKMSVQNLAAATIQKFVRARQESGGQPRPRPANDGVPLNTRMFSGRSATVDGDVSGLHSEMAELRGQLRDIHAMLADMHKKMAQPMDI